MARENDELRLSIKRLERKNQIMEIAEIVAPFFRSKKKDKKGHPARFISVKDVQFNKTVRESFVEFDVAIELLSDQGHLDQSIIIREYKGSDYFEEELYRYSKLEQRCMQFPTVTLLSMIHIDKANIRIVYEKQAGFTIYQLGLSQKLADFTLGRLAAILQGKESVSLESSGIKELFHFLLSHLPFTEEEAASIMQLLEPHFQLLSSSKAGYYPCTLFDPFKLQFIPLQDKDSITMEAIAKRGALLSVILIETPDNVIFDRMADTASVFSQRAYNEFRFSGNVDETTLSITNFFEGFITTFREFEGSNFEECYPQGSTLDMQMMLSFLLFEIYKLPGKPGGDTGFENKDPIRYIYYLLLNQPFKDIIK